jgi:hypothetical protein
MERWLESVVDEERVRLRKKRKLMKAWIGRQGWRVRNLGAWWR